MNDYLKKISGQGEKTAVLYEIFPSSSVKRYIISTPYTRKILNKPEIHGFEYTYLLRKGLHCFLKTPFAEKFFKDSDGSKYSALHFLRGGLNFNFIEQFYRCYGFTKVNSSFMTSQRVQKGEHWKIKHDQYRKFALEGVTTLIAGDVIATGTTLKNGFDCVLEMPVKLDSFIFFTIGTPYTEKIINLYEEKFRKKNKNFKAYIFYIEGRFELIEKRGELPFAVEGTDLVRKNALLSPEFEASQTISSQIERCAVYDVGARAFNWRKHFRDIVEYWGQLSESEFSVPEIYNLRWPFSYGDFDEYEKAKKKVWPDISKTVLKKMYEKEIKMLLNAIKLDSWEFFRQRLKFLKNSAQTIKWRKDV
ncbi:hypothetical protein KJ633_06395 [bacterium]|nr:hypothetical protein [bacterium]MBU3956076.1 hypothetical protein [bacterium]